MGRSVASRFAHVDVAGSALRAVIIDDDVLTLEMDFRLEPDHPDYEAPGAGETGCFHPGTIRFAGISDLTLERRNAGAGEGRQGRFAVQSFSIQGSRFAMACEWGDIQLRARSIRVATD